MVGYGLVWQTLCVWELNVLYAVVAAFAQVHVSDCVPTELLLLPLLPVPVPAVLASLCFVFLLVGCSFVVIVVVVVVFVVGVLCLSADRSCRFAWRRDY